MSDPVRRCRWAGPNLRASCMSNTTYGVRALYGGGRNLRTPEVLHAPDDCQTGVVANRPVRRVPSRNRVAQSTRRWPSRPRCGPGQKAEDSPSVGRSQNALCFALRAISNGLRPMALQESGVLATVRTRGVPGVGPGPAGVQSGFGSGLLPVGHATMSVPAPPNAPWHRTGRRALASLLLLLCLAGCTPRASGGPLPDRAGTATPSPTKPTFTPAPSATPSVTSTPVARLTASGVYDNLAVHADGRYELQLAGTRVAASFATSRSPVEHWVRRIVPQPLFTIPEPFRPPYPVLRIVEGLPVRADGTPDPERSASHRFLLRVDPNGTVHYVDDARVQGSGHLAYALHTVWGTTPPPAPTFVHAVPSPTPSLTHSGTYANRVEHADGRYALQLSGARVAATFATTRSPVQYWARDVAAPLFTVPDGFRPPYPILRTVEGRPVLADGTPNPDHPEPRRFLLRVDPDGAVHYVDDARVEGEDRQAYCLNMVGLTGVGIGTGILHPPTGITTGSLRAPAGASQPPPPSHCAAAPEHTGRFLAYSLDTVWGTTPAANDRAVLEVLDRHWFGETILSAEPPPVQFEVPEHSEHRQGTFPAARVGAFVTFDAAGRVTALGAPTNEPKTGAGAPVYNFHGPLLPELGQLHHLEHLDLGYRTHVERDAKQRAIGWGPESLTGAIPPQLWRLPRLRHLDLQGQLLAWTLPSDMGHLASLEYLDLGHNWLSGPLPPELGRLASLKHLDLGGNDFTEPLPPELGQLASLEQLDLSHSQLTGPLPPELGQLPRLQHLDLSGNGLTALPPELGQLASLQTLNLNSNELIALSPELGQLASLQTLSLNSNELTALPPELGQLASLQTLSLNSNELTALPPELGQLASLQMLSLSGNELTALPPELGQLANLERLDLDRNELTALPPELGRLVSLVQLVLSRNRLTGPLPPEWGQLANLQRLNLGGLLTGSLPPEWGQMASLEHLYLGGNQLTGPLPPEWGQLANLESLHLGGHQLTGPLPPEWGQLASLWWLSLSDNQLTGPLPPEWGQMASLARLDLNGNQLTGPLPSEWGQLATNMEWLDLRDNQLTGCFPKIAGQYDGNLRHDLPSCSPPVEQG